VLPSAPEADVEIDATLAIDPSAGNAKPPPPFEFGGAETPPALPPPLPGTDTEIPNASAFDVPTEVADGAPLEPVRARTATQPNRSDCRLTTETDYWQRLRRPPADSFRPPGSLKLRIILN
jgi:hypothetical protein